MFRLALFFLLGGFVVRNAVAQNPPPTAPVSPPPDATTRVQLQFGPHSDVRVVLRLYEHLTGRKLIYDKSVVGPMPIIVEEKVTVSEAVKIIETELLKTGFSLIPTGTKNVWRVFKGSANPQGTIQR